MQPNSEPQYITFLQEVSQVSNLSKKTPRIRTPGLTEGGILARFNAGFMAPFQGMRYLFQHPKLFKFALPPAILAGILLLIFTGLAFAHAESILSWVWAQPTGTSVWTRWLWSPLWSVLYVVTLGLLLLGSFWGSYLLSLPVAGPLNEMLSEKVEFFETGCEAPFSFRVMLANLAITVLHVLLFASMQAVALALSLALGFIPLVGQLLALLLSQFTAPLLIGFIPFDYPMTLRLWRFSQKLSLIRRNFALFYGFSLASLFLLYIPVLNLLLLPACVIASTRVVLRMEASGELTVADRRKALLARIGKVTTTESETQDEQTASSPTAE